MEDIKIDTKLIITIIGISFLIGAVVWGVYNVFWKTDGNEEIQKFEGDTSSSKIEIIGNKESDLVDEDFFIQPTIEKKFQINNENYFVAPEEWGKSIVSSDDASAEYNFPLTAKELLGINIDSGVLDMSDWTEDGTYDDFLEDFTDKIRYKNLLEGAKYTTRPITIGGKQFQIIMIETENIVGSYFCLAKNGYAYCIQAIIPKELYTETWKQNIDKIFSTFRIN